MRIAIDCRMSGKSGIGSYFDALLPHFLQAFECLLIKSPDAALPCSIPSDTAVCECDVPPFSVHELLFFPKELLAEINGCSAYYTPYCNVPGGIHIPIFTTIHDIVFLDVKGLASKTGTFVRKRFYLRAIKKSAAVFTVSNFSAQRIQQKLHCRKKIIVTYNAAPDYFSIRIGMPEKTAEEQKLPHSVLFVGNIKKHKGLTVLLDAFRTVRAALADAQLIIVGNAEHFRTGDTSVFSKISTFPENSVRFTGKISNEELKSWYKKASVLVQPSFYEGFGMPPLEALSCGTNAVISDIPVFKEIYNDFPVTFFRTGDSADLAEKIQSAMTLPEVQTVPDVYSFDRTFRIIEETVCSILTAKQNAQQDHVFL